ncbi:hypothetical protein VE01_06184 [Pseudogymnoascus verrucosus]|uniref:Uncharacterized protein n=1 Tax=Pseudogymnoascus verrucosus TaxID=342668 RepID=A0A1B8GFW5_9PEZI|nr:uncharacterized protein VE01_06184 [Pseudogymnoascus verrucosus]OBT94739.1 hypothetical protein VE01_06184 [Pseudogymnoascus verrucosus]
MSSPWKNNQPEVVADRVLRRAEVSKMARKLQNRLALAQFKAKHGWEDLTLDLIEPKVDEHLRRQRPSSAGDMLSDTSSSSASDFNYPRTVLSSSPLKAPFFSDALDSSSGSSGHRKRSYNATFHNPSQSTARKRFRSSPSAGRSMSQSHTSWKDQHQLSQSSPIKPRKQPHFTTSAGPNLSFFRGVSGTIAEDIPSSAHPSLDSNSDSDSDLLPLHSFKLPSNTNISRSSPPRTPPPRHRAITRRTTANANNTTTTLTTNNPSLTRKSGEEGADLLLYLATSPSPAHPRSNRMHPPQTPPSKPLALPSSMMTTPGGGLGLLSAFGVGGGGPHTPSQTFDFADFVNITPSPAQGAWTTRTPASALREGRGRGEMPTSSPMFGVGRGRMGGGLGMELGGELLS